VAFYLEAEMPTERRLDVLAWHLAENRQQLLEAWRDRLARDPELTTQSGLPRASLDDHIPWILETLERRLRAAHDPEVARAELEERQSAAEHGTHRWQQGFNLRETIREWGHLQLVVLSELELCAARHQIDAEPLRRARAILTRLCMEGTCESAARYAQLHQTEAASRLRDLERSLEALQALESQRAQLLRDTAHDLRGSVGVVANASALLFQAELAPPDRTRFYGVLQNRIRWTSALLSELAELARLEAGQDPPRLRSFDVADCLKECCEGVRAGATEKGLFLRCQGPQPFVVEGDPIKTQRIAQNLLLNALRATTVGGVEIGWGSHESSAATQWVMTVRDTGPGIEARDAAPLLQALDAATQHAADADPARAPQPANPAPPPGGPRAPATEERPGEGIGLSIVKRLCEVLGANIDLQTTPDSGTVFRITFPAAYPKGTQ
jgi:signal transduction histidine kinase